MSLVSELIVADEEVVVAGGVLSEQPTTVIRAQTARRERTRFFISCRSLKQSPSQVVNVGKKAAFRGRVLNLFLSKPFWTDKKQEDVEMQPQNARQKTIGPVCEETVEPLTRNRFTLGQIGGCP
jgi:hypothetical protein